MESTTLLQDLVPWFAFPAAVAGYYFPRLYPEGVEFTQNQKS